MKRNLIRLGLLAMMLAFCLAITLSFTAVPRASAAARVNAVAAANPLGGVNLRAYCQSLGYADVTLIGSTVADWRCVGSDGSLAGINMDSVCAWQYSVIPRLGQNVLRAENYYVATSGVCYRVRPSLGGINLRAYCQSLGYANVTTVGSTVYDWACAGSDGSLAGINLDSACAWQYPDYGTSAIYRYDDFFVMTSIACWWATS